MKTSTLISLFLLSILVHQAQGIFMLQYHNFLLIFFISVLVIYLGIYLYILDVILNNLAFFLAGIRLVKGSLSAKMHKLHVSISMEFYMFDTIN